MIENEFVHVSQTTFSSDSLPLRIMSDDLPLLIVTLPFEELGSSQFRFRAGRVELCKRQVSDQGLR